MKAIFTAIFMFFVFVGANAADINSGHDVSVFTIGADSFFTLHKEVVNVDGLKVDKVIPGRFALSYESADTEKGHLVQTVITRHSYLTYNVGPVGSNGIEKTETAQNEYVTGHQVYFKNNVCTRYDWRQTGVTKQLKSGTIHMVPTTFDEEIPSIEESETIVSCDPFV